MVDFFYNREKQIDLDLDWLNDSQADKSNDIIRKALGKNTFLSYQIESAFNLKRIIRHSDFFGRNNFLKEAAT